MFNRLWLLIVFLLLQIFCATAWAQTEPAALGYRPYVPQAAGADWTVPLFVIFAYSAIWLVVLIFVWSIWQRQRRLEQTLHILHSRLFSEPK